LLFFPQCCSRFLISIPVVERYPTKLKPARSVKPEPSVVAGNSHRDAACASECSGAKQRRHTDYGLEGGGFLTAGQWPTSKDCFLFGEYSCFGACSSPATAHIYQPHRLKGQDPGATIVILFDTLNTDFEDQAFARQQVLQFLHSFKPQDHVAIFSLTTDLLLLHGFTEDAAALSSAVDRFSPRLLAAFDASHPTDFHVPGLENDPFFNSFENHVNNANGEIADLRIADRFRITYSALVAIAGTVSRHSRLVREADGYQDFQHIAFG
jgi:hypothetical protein